MWWCTILVAGATAWTLTHTGINGQVWQTASGTRLLVDPILVGDLTFGDLPALYAARPRRRLPAALREELLAGRHVDGVVLTQGLPDHAHAPTLRSLRLAANQPIVGPPSAADLVAKCGHGAAFRPLRHGDRVRIADVDVEALAGASVGPPWAVRENAVLATGGGERSGLFYEPHGDIGEDSARLRRAVRGRAGVLVAPAVAQRVAGVFDLVKGARELRRLAEDLGVREVVALPNGDVDATGAVAAFVSEVGDVDAAAATLRRAGIRLRRWDDVGQALEVGDQEEEEEEHPARLT